MAAAQLLVGRCDNASDSRSSLARPLNCDTAIAAGNAVLGARMHRQSTASRAEEAWLSQDGMQHMCVGAFGSQQGWIRAFPWHDRHDGHAPAEKIPGDTIVAAKNRSTWVMPSENLPNVAVRRVDRVHATIANMRFSLRFPIIVSVQATV